MDYRDKLIELKEEADEERSKDREKEIRILEKQMKETDKKLGRML